MSQDMPPADVPPAGVLVLTGALTLQTVEAVQAQLMDLADRDHVAIDCSEATEVDLSLVQLLLAARSAARQSGRTLALARPAAGALLDTLERGGFLSPDAERSDDDRTFWFGTRS